MKFSLVILASLLATISNASPTPKEVDIHIDLKVEDSTPVAAQEKVVLQKDTFYTQDYCLRVCFPPQTTCPPNWYAKEDGNCWTCCMPSSNLVAPEPAKTQYVIDAAPSKPSRDLFTIQDICWRVCFPQQTPCPANWYSQKDGGCWTCCTASSQIDNFVAPEPEKTQYVIDAAPSKDLFTMEDICWRVCFPQQPTCPTNWYAKQIGGCWTCCIASDDLVAPEPAKTQYVIDAAPSKQSKDLFTMEDTCWYRFCLPQPPPCPTNWYAKLIGNCWTCCGSPDSSDALDAAEL